LGGARPLARARAVPDVRGLTLRQAAETLADAGLVLEIDGEGLAVDQNPPPGETVMRGSRVRVRFAPPG